MARERAWKQPMEPSAWLSLPFGPQPHRTRWNPHDSRRTPTLILQSTDWAIDTGATNTRGEELPHSPLGRLSFPSLPLSSRNRHSQTPLQDGSTVRNNAKRNASRGSSEIPSFPALFPAFWPSPDPPDVPEPAYRLETVGDSVDSYDLPACQTATATLKGCQCRPF